MAGRITSSGKRFSEARLSQIWQGQLFSDKELITSDGQKVKVIFPGRRSREAGPDFCGAIISLNGSVPLRGDVELHVCSSNWLGHKHQYDPFYNQVILHVVLEHDSATLTPLQNGDMIPILPLDGRVNTTSRLPMKSYLEPCQLRTKHKSDLPMILEMAGEERFSQKASAFQADIEAIGPEQTLYKGIMRALGYSHNKEPFQELSEQVPLVGLEQMARVENPDYACLMLQAYLMGSAGLLPEQRGMKLAESDQGNELGEIWHLMGAPRTNFTHGWRYRGVRPENWPTRRLAAASQLITNSAPSGLLASVLKIFDSDSSKLEDSFKIPAQGYWIDRYDFGVTGARGTPLIGQGRAGEITVNVCLPLLQAWGTAHQRPQISSLALELYKSYPRTADNQIIRLMKDLLFPENSFRLKTACQQQGLLHLYHSFCYEKRCDDCCNWVKS